MSSRTLLLIEDNPTTRKMFRVALEIEGYSVVEAGTGRAALEVMRQHSVDLVLQDWILPDMGGLELARALRALPGGRERPIVALSGFHRMVEEVRGSPDAFDAVLLKPVELSALFTTVAAYLPASVADEVVGDGKGRHVLVVDDDGVQRKLATLHLCSAGFRVTGAGDAQTALVMARADKPDVISSEVLMPGLDGFELCRALRADPELAGIPIVLTSAHFEAGRDDVFARDCGADAFVERNHDPQRLIDAVLDALDRPRVRESGGSAPEPREYTQHVVHQLKREVKVSTELLERSALQTAQLSILGGIADALARSTDPERVLSDALASCLDAGGISKGALFEAERDGQLRPRHSIGLSDWEREQLLTLFGHPQYLDELCRAQAISGASAAPSLLTRAGLRVLVMVPCLSDGQTVGALLLGSNDARVTELDLLSFGRAMATFVSQALMLADSFAALRESAEASRRLFSSLDLAETLDTLAQVATARLADFCDIALLEAVGAARARTILHVDPATTRRMRELCESHAAAGTPRFIRDVLETRSSELVSELTPQIIAASEEPHASMMKAIGARSRIVVPLLGRDGVLGTVLLCTARRRHYESSDLVLAEDLARRAALALENARLYEEMSAANKLKDEFLATVSHELRTPLNAILGWTHMLKSHDLPQGQRTHAIEVIERNALSQTRLIEDLLDISKMVAGKLDVEVSFIDLASVVAAAIDSVRPAIDAKGITLVPPPAGAPVRVLGDARRLQQVVWNMLANAVKFTPRGGNVRIELHVADDSVRLCVIDDGAGIDPEFLPFVFERFKQADGRINRKYGGLGIGLAICRDIVALHGGSVTARSDGADRGATFEMKLPCNPERELLHKRRRASDSDGALHGAAKTWPELRSLKVLIVDDDQDARDMLFELMQRYGARPCLAESAADALEAIHREPPDVMLADIGMPGEDGYSLIRKLRAMPVPAACSIPAAALTGHVRPEDRVAALTAGFQMHVAKPIDMNVLLDVVSNLARMATVLKAGSSAANLT